MNNFIRKISSRKLWIAIVGIITGIAMTFGISESEISTVSGTVLALASAVTYIMAEGKVDAESVKKSVGSKGGDNSGS